MMLTVLCVLVFVPVSALALLFHWRPIDGTTKHHDGGWNFRVAQGSKGSQRRAFGAEPRRATLTRRTPRWVVALAFVSALMIVDLAAGAVLSGTHVLDPLDRGDLYQTFHPRQEEPDPALQSGPWEPQLEEELVAFQEAGEFHYVPFLQQGMHEFHGRYVNTTNSERVSYQPAVSPGMTPLRVAFFGGSVMFGLGQRDNHTIPSEIARIAEENGITLEVHNYGLPRWVTWQEFQYLERLLANGKRYDLVVFLDGFNEFLVQAENYSRDPTHHAASALGEIISEARDERERPPGFFDGLAELAATYRRNSAVWRLADHLAGRNVSLPGARDAVHADPDQQASAALDIYDRSTRLIEDLAHDHNTTARFFWQPQRSGWPSSVTNRLPARVTDASHVFDGMENRIYHSGNPIHTNERGAHLLAEMMWSTLGPDLEQAERRPLTSTSSKDVPTE